jgi:hypothetical protein
MSQKPPEPSDKGSKKQDEAAPAEGGSDRPAPRGKPVVPRGLGLAGDTTRPPQPVVSFGEPEPLPAFEQDRETLPPPIPMEQLIAQMMQPEVDPGMVDTQPPPGNDKDTIRPRGDEAQTEPPLGDDGRDTLPPGSENMRTTLLPRGGDMPTPPPHQDSMATMPPPPASDRDTLPPGGDEEPDDLAPRGPVQRVPPARESTASTSRAIETAEAVFQELGVELFAPHSAARSGEEPPRTRPPEDPRSRSGEEPPRSRSGEEPPRSRSGEEPPRTRPPEPPPPVRARFISRPTPRGMRAVADPPPPPSSTAGRAGAMRRRPSEQGFRPEPPSTTGDRHTPSGQHSIPASERLNEVRERYEAQDYQGALALAESILADNPDHIAALGYAESCRQMLRQMYLSKIGDTSLIPHVTMTPDELLRLGLDLRAARLIASIDGTLTIDDVVGMSGLPPLDALKLLNELIEDGVIELDSHPRGRR